MSFSEERENAELKRLMEVLRQAGVVEKCSNFTFVYVASGGQHVGHVENQYFYDESHTHQVPPRVGRKAEPGELPEVLSTEAAMRLWQKAQEAGWIDANYQPLISRTQSALLAETMARRLGIRKKWKTFETLWNKKNMRSDYNLALSQQQTLDFQDELKRAFAS